MKTNIIIGKIYVNKTNQNVVVEAVDFDYEPTFIESGLFRGKVLSSKLNHKIGYIYLFSHLAFELKYIPPTLFQVIQEYQNKGFNIDFDKGRLNQNICYVGKVGNGRQHLKFSYNDNVSEGFLVMEILYRLAMTGAESAREQYNEMKEFNRKQS